jgi:hypothetical protein
VKKPRTGDVQVAQFELWKDMFIAGLALVGVPQLEISKVVRVDLNRVNRIAKSLNKRKKA